MTGRAAGVREASRKETAGRFATLSTSAYGDLSVASGEKRLFAARRGQDWQWSDGQEKRVEAICAPYRREHVRDRWRHDDRGPSAAVAGQGGNRHYRQDRNVVRVCRS